MQLTICQNYRYQKTLLKSFRIHDCIAPSIFKPKKKVTIIANVTVLNNVDFSHMHTFFCLALRMRNR
jgi:hypothetical protein